MRVMQPTLLLVLLLYVSSLGVHVRGDTGGTHNVGGKSTADVEKEYKALEALAISKHYYFEHVEFEARQAVAAAKAVGGSDTDRASARVRAEQALKAAMEAKAEAQGAWAKAGEALAKAGGHSYKVKAPSFVHEKGDEAVVRDGPDIEDKGQSDPENKYKVLEERAVQAEKEAVRAEQLADEAWAELETAIEGVTTSRNAVAKAKDLIKNTAEANAQKAGLRANEASYKYESAKALAAVAMANADEARQRAREADQAWIRPKEANPHSENDTTLMLNITYSNLMKQHSNR